MEDIVSGCGAGRQRTMVRVCGPATTRAASSPSGPCAAHDARRGCRALCGPAVPAANGCEGAAKRLEGVRGSAKLCGDRRRLAAWRNEAVRCGGRALPRGGVRRRDERALMADIVTDRGAGLQRTMVRARGPAGTFGRSRTIWRRICSTMRNAKRGRTRTRTSTATSLFDAASRMDAAVPRLPCRLVGHAPRRGPARATKRSDGVRVQCERQAVPRAEPVDAGGRPAGSVPERVPPGRHARPALPPLAARRDRQTVPLVLPVRFPCEGDRLRAGQRPILMRSSPECSCAGLRRTIGLHLRRSASEFSS